MSKSILELNPNRFWNYFCEICKIPHGSGREAGVRDYIINVAKEFGLEYQVDQKGNIVVRKPANKSDSKDTVVIQGHLDMVCEAETGYDVDFSTTSIIPKIEGEYLTADRTSLGADNGVAIAAALSIMEDNGLVHGPLEFLMTVEEETGLFGAMALEAGFIKGKKLINLDSEDEGVFFIGCAGGEFINTKMSYTREPVSNEHSGLEIYVSGLKGGHSGLVIHEQRANAVKLLGRILAEINRNCEIRISSVSGGTKHNVIPSDSRAVLGIKKGDKEKIVQIVKNMEDSFIKELSISDPCVKVELKDAKVVQVVDKNSSQNIINVVNSIYHGVIMMSLKLKGLVQTSANFAVLATKEDHFYIECSTRSSCASEMEMYKSSVRSILSLAGSDLERFGGYPCWDPNPDSGLLKTVVGVYKDMNGDEPKVTAIHAGLECGVIGSKYEDMDMVSFGPQMHDVHSSNERIKIKSMERIYDMLIKTLAVLAK